MTEQAPLDQSQRIRVEMDETGQLVKIRVEHYDECLGWYSSGSLSFPAHQLSSLQQGIETLQAGQSMPTGTIIPFPGMLGRSG